MSGDNSDFRRSEYPLHLPDEKDVAEDWYINLARVLTANLIGLVEPRRKPVGWWNSNFTVEELWSNNFNIKILNSNNTYACIGHMSLWNWTCLYNVVSEVISMVLEEDDLLGPRPIGDHYSSCPLLIYPHISSSSSSW